MRIVAVRIRFMGQLSGYRAVSWELEMKTAFEGGYSFGYRLKARDKRELRPL